MRLLMLIAILATTACVASEDCPPDAKLCLCSDSDRCPEPPGDECDNDADCWNPWDAQECVHGYCT